MMNFFEALRERAGKTVDIQEEEYGNPPHSFAVTGYGGIKATIEALKEMTVGEPIPMRLELFHRSDKEVSTLLYDGNDELHARWIGEHGTDGEEVIVMVFRVEEKE